MADLLGNMNSALVSVYTQAKMAEVPSVVAMSKGFAGAQEAALGMTEKGFAALGAGKAAGRSFDADAAGADFDDSDASKGLEGDALDDARSKYIEDQKQKTIMEARAKGFKGDTTTTPQYTATQLKELYDEGAITREQFHQASGFNYSPLKQTESSTEETTEPTPPTQDINEKWNEVKNLPNVNELTVNEYNAQRQVLQTAIDSVVDGGPVEPVNALMNTLADGVNPEEKEIKSLVSNSEWSSGVTDEIKQNVAEYLTGPKVMGMNPDTGGYEYITPKEDGTFLTKKRILEYVDQATINDEAKSLDLKYQNTIIEDAKDATINRPKDMAHFGVLAKNVWEENPMKTIDLIHGDFMDGRSFADDIAQHPKILALPEDQRAGVIDALVNTGNPNFNAETTKDYWVTWKAGGYTQLHGNVNKPKSPIGGKSPGGKTTEEYLKAANIDPNLFK